jgi:DNA-binding GntR family transcriptional regulator
VRRDPLGPNPDPAPKRARLRGQSGSQLLPASATETPDRATSLSSQIYERLREGIIRGRYPQGSRLIESRLAQELDVSRVPLREAIPLLAVDGFVHTVPQRGMVVMNWTTRSAHDLFDLRLCLEVGATRYAARRAREGTSVAPLEAALARSHEGMATGDAYRIAGDAARFHETIVQLTGNGLMQSLMESVAGRMMWLFFLTSELDPVAALADHEELLAAIASGNEGLAEAIAYAHIERDRDESMQVLELRGIRAL